MGIGCNDKTAFSGCHERTGGPSLVGDIHRAARGQLQERTGVQGNQSSIRGKSAVQDHHRPVGFNGLSFNHAAKDDSAAHGGEFCGVGLNQPLVVEGQSEGITRAKEHRSALNAAGVFYRGQSREITGGLTRAGRVGQKFTVNFRVQTSA